MKINVPEWLKNLTAIVIALGVLFSFNAAYRADVISTAAAATKDVEKQGKSTKSEVDLLKEEFHQHVKEERQAHVELQEDSRALYRAMISRQPSPRLEGPPTLAGDAGLIAHDGGP